MARIIEVRDAIKTRINELWHPDDREGPDDEVLTPWVFRIAAATIRGRKIFIFPSAYLSEMATRKSDQGDYTYVLFVCERYREQGDPQDAWIDERVSFCEWLVNAVGDARGPKLLDTLWPETSGVELVYDTEELTERKLFCSVLNVTYREIT